MRLREKGKKDAEPVSMGWDEAQAALQAGTHEAADGDGDSSGEAVKAAVPADADARPADDLDGKTRPELEALAKERGIDISAAKTKADIVEALRKA